MQIKDKEAVAASDGLVYRMPAEWERHEATWLSWPKNPATFPPGILERVESIYVNMIEALASGEKVNLLVDDAKAEGRVDRLLSKNKENVSFYRLKTADVWVRDYGPIFVRTSYRNLVENVVRQIAAVKWVFNAWGRKYDDLLVDNDSGSLIARFAGFRTFEPGMVLEGGSIDVNGRGTLLTTKQCLLNKNRNPSLNREQVEKYLERYLGASKVIWLESGIEGDDTDGHIDDIARFVNENKILCMVEENPDDANYQSLRSNLEALIEASDQNGENLEVVPLQMPKRRVMDSEGARLPASYANFYIGNSAVLVPTYNDKHDSQALATIRDIFPRRSVIGIDCEPLLWGFGAIHCVTQQQPISS